MRYLYLCVVIVLSQIALCSGNTLFADGKILFVSDRDELANWDIYSMNSDGTGITRLTDANIICQRWERSYRCRRTARMGYRYLRYELRWLRIGIQPG